MTEGKNKKITVPLDEGCFLCECARTMILPDEDCAVCLNREAQEWLKGIDKTATNYCPFRKTKPITHITYKYELDND